MRRDIVRILKLIELGRSDSEEEGMAALGRARWLMLRKGITAQDLADFGLNMVLADSPNPFRPPPANWEPDVPDKPTRKQQIILLFGKDWFKFFIVFCTCSLYMHFAMSLGTSLVMRPEDWVWTMSIYVFDSMLLSWVLWSWFIRKKK